MNTLKLSLVSLGCGLGLLVSASAQAPNPAAPPPTDSKTNDVAPPVPAPAEQPAVPPAPSTNAPPPSRPPEGPPGGELMRFIPPPGPVVADGEKGLRLNFRNAPLEMVLNYLSDSAGFVIIPEVEVKGRVDVWSNQPLTKDEAVDVLNSVLNKNGYAALRNGRTLTIVSKEEAKKRDIPVKSGSDPAGIPKNDEIVTQILPVKYINATQLTRDLMPLLPTTAQMSANEAGNALVITDTQVNIRRMAEIVKALDTALSSVSRVRVFPLKFADAKALASVVKELFTSQQDSSRNNNSDPRARFFNMMRGRDGGGGPPGFGQGGDMGGGGGGGGGSGSSGGARAPTPKVVAVADERSNALVVSAPEEQMPIIEDLVQQVDTNVDEITELRVFRLKHADAQETADLLASLFPDSSNSSQGTRGQLQFGGRGGRGGFGGFGGNQGANNTASQSARMQAQTRVVAVADMRTRSVVVSAARDLMDQIAGMIEELDSDPSQKQKVFVFSLENTDPQTVQETLESLFPAPTTSGYGSARSSRNSSTRQTGNQLNNRATQTQNQSTRPSSTGNTGGSGRSYNQ